MYLVTLRTLLNDSLASLSGLSLFRAPLGVYGLPLVPLFHCATNHVHVADEHNLKALCIFFSSFPRLYSLLSHCYLFYYFYFA